MTEITRDTAAKVLEVVDRGLSHGLGVQKPGEMCVEAAVCYALGLPHGDDPGCVSRALRLLKIRLNDSGWSSKEVRAKGLRRLAVAQLGSRDHLDDMEFTKRVARLAITLSVPTALRAAASVQKSAEHRAALLDAAAKCEREGTRESAFEATRVAKDANASAANASAANAADYANAAAANAAIATDAAAAADAASAANASAANAADYANAAAPNAAAAADAASAATASAANDDARDKSLAAFAEGVVQILIEMKAPGCQWLDLTEAA